MSLIADLLSRHGAALDADQHRAAAEFARRFDAAETFAYPEDLSELDAQTGFVLFEREFSARPVRLFGQDVASLAHTRMRIFRGRPAAGGGHEVAEEIFSARISEKSLTEAMLLSNRGEGAPMTVTRLGDFDVPERTDASLKTERAKEAYRGKQDDAIDMAVAGVSSILATEPARSNAELREAVSDLGYRIRDLVSTSYDLERHLESMSMVRAEVLTEAAHAALHAQKITEALARGATALPAPEPIDWDAAASEHPMVDAILDPLPHDYREALRIMIVSEMERLAETYPKLAAWIATTEEGTVVRFPENRDRGLAFGYNDDSKKDRAHIDSLGILWNWAFNPHVADSRARRDATQASLSVTQRQGWLGNIHSSLPPTEGSCFGLKIMAAWEHHDLGTGRTRSANERLVEIEMVAEDLMTALRGHPEGLAVPCSIRSLCSVWHPSVERPRHELTADIKSIADEIKAAPEIKELLAAREELTELANSKRTGKAWRAELQAALERIETALVAAKDRVETDTTAGREHIDRAVVKSAEEILSSISRALPREALDILQITDSSSDR